MKLEIYHNKTDNFYIPFIPELNLYVGLLITDILI